MDKEGFSFFHERNAPKPPRRERGRDLGHDMDDPYGLYGESYWDSVKKGGKSPRGAKSFKGQEEAQKQRNRGGRPKGSQDGKPRIRRTRKALEEARHGAVNAERDNRGGEDSSGKTVRKHNPR